MQQLVHDGYLARTEANQVAVRPGPNVIYLRLIRAFESEGRETCMFTEMTPGHALQLVRELEASVRLALRRSE